jgi:hypothetical protein
VLTIQLVTTDSRSGHWISTAQAFCGRSDTAAVINGAGDVRLHLDSPAEPGEDAWTFSDGVGRNVLSGEGAARACRSGATDWLVEIRRRDAVLSRGRLPVRRDAANTVSLAMEALGPLLTMAATGGPVPPVSTQDQRPPGRLNRALLRALANRARATFGNSNWQVARLPMSIDDLAAGRPITGRIRWQGPSRRAFWADPCVVVGDSQRWLFVEELPRRTGLGVISAVPVDQGSCGKSRTVLATGHHLSFPQIYRIGGRWLGTVQTCAADNPIYEFDALGTAWRPAPDQPKLPSFISDPVVVFDADGVASQVWGGDDTVGDGNVVFVQWRFQDATWQRRDDTLLVDVTCARPGGSLDGERDLRVSQDCGPLYGYGFGLHHLAAPSPFRRFAGPELPRGTDGRRRRAAHTLTWDASGSEVWIDGWLYRPSLLGLYWQRTEGRHVRCCSG